MRIKINGEKLVALSEILLIPYLCLPITIYLLNSISIRALTFTAAILFILGMVMQKRWGYLVQFAGLFLIILLYLCIVRRNRPDLLSYIYYSFASLSFVFGGIVIFQSRELSMIRLLFVLLTVIFIVTAITTIIGLDTYPLAAREMAREYAYDASQNIEVNRTIYRRMNIAGWGQIYGMLFFVPSICILWKNTKKSYWIIAILLFLITIIISQITFAVILSLAFLLGVLTIGNNNAKTIIFLIFMFIAAIVVLLNSESILTWVVNVSNDFEFDFLRDKLNDLKQLLLYKQVVGDASGRKDVYMASIDSYLKSPVVGRLFNPNLKQGDIGGHSELLDVIGVTGLIGIISICISFAKYFKFLQKINPVYRREMIIVFLGFIVLFAINPVFNSPPVFIGAFLYPLLCIKICEIGLFEKISHECPGNNMYYKRFFYSSKFAKEKGRF